jgi:UDP-N-acetylglucosamine 2-epimerase (non-hydrolysing)
MASPPRNRVLLVAGTRPEAIKLAPVWHELRRRPLWEARLCVTGQHRQMLAQAMDAFALHADYDLDLMREGQDLLALTARCIAALGELLRGECSAGGWRPDWIVVQGDTTTTMAAALSAFYAGIPVAHVEAGLRSGDPRRPFPEEVNRRLVTQLAALHFAPTARAAAALRAEGVPPCGIRITGNTVVDALLAIRKNGVPPWPVAPGRRLILVTGHRREHFGEGLRRICKALDRLGRRSDVEIVYPVHLNPQVRRPVQAILADRPNIRLLEPLGYLPFVGLMEASWMILTDSGGIQEEAPTLGKPVLVMRDVTERPEAVAAGVARLVGCSTDAIVQAASELLDDPAAYARMSRTANPFGDGRAAQRIVDAMELYIEKGTEKPTNADEPIMAAGKRPPENMKTGSRAGDRVLRANGPAYASPGQRPGNRVVRDPALKGRPRGQPSRSPLQGYDPNP